MQGPEGCAVRVGKSMGMLRGPSWVPRVGEEGRGGPCVPRLCVEGGVPCEQTARAPGRHLEGESLSTHQSQFPRTLCLGPLTAGWLHGHSHRPGEGRPRQETHAQNCLLRALCTQSPGAPSHTPTHLLVLLQGNAGLSPILGLNEEQLIPLDVFKNALGKDRQQAGQAGGWYRHPG